MATRGDTNPGAPGYLGLWAASLHMTPAPGASPTPGPGAGEVGPRSCLSELRPPPLPALRIRLRTRLPLGLFRSENTVFQRTRSLSLSGAGERRTTKGRERTPAGVTGAGVPLHPTLRAEND